MSSLSRNERVGEALEFDSTSKQSARTRRWFDASFLYLILLALLVVACVAHERIERARSRARVTEAARAFVGALEPAQRLRGVFAFEDGERRNWHFVPRDRHGLRLAELSPPQVERVHALLRATLSARGYSKVTGVVELESILAELDGAPGKPHPMRDPGRYCVTVFGTPGESPWSWRFEGHHIALNVVVEDDRIVATTPYFLGANPARVASGPRAGFAVLGREEELARELVTRLTPEQLQLATLPGEVPSDVILAPGRDHGFDARVGLPLSAMDVEQRALANELLRAVIDDLEPDAAESAFARFTRCGEQELRFAWNGGTRPGEPHYWRFDAVTAAIEWDNVQNGANHAHLLWRDLENDFGDDVLRRHHEDEHGSRVTR